MAKKSAKSKGYRKSVAKKPYLSKRDIVILCVLVAVLAVGAILLFTYDDGALKVKDGKIVDPGENWLIVNGNTKGGRRYFKLGEVGDIEGYASEAQPFASDENLNQFNFTPEAEDGAVTGITISASPYAPARLAEGYAKMVAAIDGSTVSEVATASAGDVEYTYYTYTHEYYAEEEADAGEAGAADEAAEEEAVEETADEADAGEAEAADEAAEAEVGEEAADEADAEPNHFDQVMNAYVGASHDASVVIAISAEADSADDYLTEDQLREIAAQAIAAVTLEPGK